MIPAPLAASLRRPPFSHDWPTRPPITMPTIAVKVAYSAVFLRASARSLRISSPTSTLIVCWAALGLAFASFLVCHGGTGMPGERPIGGGAMPMGGRTLPAWDGAGAGARGTPGLESAGGGADPGAEGPGTGRGTGAAAPPDNVDVLPSRALRSILLFFLSSAIGSS